MLAGCEPRMRFRDHESVIGYNAQYELLALQQNVIMIVNWVL